MISGLTASSALLLAASQAVRVQTQQSSSGYSVRFLYAYSNLEFKNAFLDQGEADTRTDARLVIETTGGYEYTSPTIMNGGTNFNFSDVMPRDENSLEFTVDSDDSLSLQMWDTDFGIDEPLGEVQISFTDACDANG